MGCNEEVSVVALVTTWLLWSGSVSVQMPISKYIHCTIFSPSQNVQFHTEWRQGIQPGVHSLNQSASHYRSTAE